MPAKVKLSLDRLHVESFEPQARDDASRGTVRGLDVSIETCFDGTCRGYGTCGIYPCKPIP